MVPAAISVSAVLNDQRLIATTGDGSPLQTVQGSKAISYYTLPAKLFNWNRDRYPSIREFQNSYSEKLGIGKGSGFKIAVPGTPNICTTFGITVGRKSEVSGSDGTSKRPINLERQYVLKTIMLPEEIIARKFFFRTNPRSPISSRSL
jgi:thiamine pyrophosphate-dependent acetolactate synthase large subunit-like protein